jgi:hypothetical protein
MTRSAPPAEQATAKYAPADVQAPRLTGTYLRVASFLAKTFLNPYIYGIVVKRSGLPKVKPYVICWLAFRPCVLQPQPALPRAGYCSAYIRVHSLQVLDEVSYPEDPR